MSQITIDVTPEQHERLKEVAHSAGKSVEEYVLGRVLDSETNAMAELESFLEPRIAAAKRGEVSTRSAMDVLKSYRTGS